RRRRRARRAVQNPTGAHATSARLGEHTMNHPLDPRLLPYLGLPTARPREAFDDWALPRGMGRGRSAPSLEQSLAAVDRAMGLGQAEVQARRGVAIDARGRLTISTLLPGQRACRLPPGG